MPVNNQIGQIELQILRAVTTGSSAVLVKLRQELEDYHGENAVAARLIVSAALHRTRQNLVDAQTDIQQAYSELQPQLPTLLLGIAAELQAAIGALTSASFEWEEYLQEAHAVYQKVGSHTGIARVEYARGVILLFSARYDSAIRHLSRSLELFDEQNDGAGAAWANDRLGLCYYQTGDFTKGLPFYERALEIWTELALPDLVGNVTISISVIHTNLGDYSTAERLLNQAMAVLSGIGNSTGMARALLSLGSIHIDRSEFDSAIDCLTRSLHISEKENNSHSMALCYNNLGNAHVGINRTGTAIELYQKALELNERDGEERDAAMVLANIGNIYFDCGEYPTALEYYNKALEVYERTGAMNRIGHTLASIGGVYCDTGDVDQALEYFNRALEIAQELGDRPREITVAINIGYALSLQKAYIDAESHLRNAANAARSIGNVKLAANATSFLGKLFVDMERFDEAQSVIDGFEETYTTAYRQTTLVRNVRALIAAHHKDYALALELLELSRSEAEEREEKNTLAEIHQYFCDVARASADFELYLHHNDMVRKLQEEVRGAQARRKISLQEANQKIQQQTREHEKQLAILHSTLPKHIADRVVNGEVVNDHIDAASVLFLDIVGFTAISSRIPADHVVHLLDTIFAVCDRVCNVHHVTKIKTIGDSYMAVAGLQQSNTSHAESAASVALEILKAMKKLVIRMPPGSGNADWVQELGQIDVRIGLHSGPVVAGVIGRERLQYDVWGDTVNVASRMESTGEPGRVQVSESFARALGKVPGAECLVPGSMDEHAHPQALGTRHQALTKRGTIDIKGKGTMTTYWLEERSA